MGMDQIAGNTYLDELLPGVLVNLQQISRQKEYLWNPVLWAEEVLGMTLWSAQKEILMSLAINKKTAVKSCHSIGKTTLSAIATAWWVSTRPDSMVQTTAPTYAQVHGQLWEQVRKFHAEHSLPGRITQSDQWKRELLKGGKAVEAMVAEGKKPADGNQHGFQGVHRPDGVLAILDEACGIAETIYTGADAITTYAGDRVLAVGNPDDPNTEFGRLWREQSGEWNLITVSAYATPAFTEEWKTLPAALVEHLPDPDWIESRKREWGEDSSRFKSKVLAEFPDVGSDSFFSQSTIDKAFDSDIPDDLELPAILGVDVAGWGDDYSVVYINRGGRVRQFSKWNGADAVESEGRIVDAILRTGATECRIDSAGMGGPIFQHLTKNDNIPSTCTVIGINGGASAWDNSRHLNARAEQYDNLRALMADSKIDLDPTDDKLYKQLLAIKYGFTQKGSIQIESKKIMKARGTSSPDELDGVVYATLDATPLTENPLGHLAKGDQVSLSPWDLMQASRGGPGYPI